METISQREKYLAQAYNVVTGNDGDWNPDRTQHAIERLWDMAVERSALIAESVGHSWSGAGATASFEAAERIRTELAEGRHYA